MLWLETYDEFRSEIVPKRSLSFPLLLDFLKNVKNFFIAFLIWTVVASREDTAVFVIAETRDDTTGRAHQANVYPRRILMRRVSRGGPANVCSDIHKPNYPLSLCITSNSRSSVTPALNNRGTVQFASFAIKACEFNEKFGVTKYIVPYNRAIRKFTRMRRNVLF